MARDLLPGELRRAAARWGAAFVRSCLVGAAAKHRHTLVIRRRDDSEYDERDALYDAARAYVATKIDPRAMRRLGLSRSLSKQADGSSSWRTMLSMEPGDSTTDVFDGVEFKWTSVEAVTDDDGDGKKCKVRLSLELSFDGEHTATAIERYIPFVMSTVDQMQRRERVLKIYMNDTRSWHGVKHHHPSTFDTIAMDPALKRDIVADLDRFMKRKDYYRRIGKAWKRWYLLYGPPGTGKSSLVAAIGKHSDDDEEEMERRPWEVQRQQSLTLSGLINFIDGLWSTSGEQRVFVFTTTNYKERLDAALLRPGRMDMHIYMGYCGWDGTPSRRSRTTTSSSTITRYTGAACRRVEVEVTPAEVSEMLLRSEDADLALQGLTRLLADRRREASSKAEIKDD
uniref:AAA+ ATPase domain-containing protein n=1 Tax=Leersia perrieri TaxID=77586 RepID=A0A0D9WZI2_9ORYZ